MTLPKNTPEVKKVLSTSEQKEALEPKVELILEKIADTLNEELHRGLKYVKRPQKPANIKEGEKNAEITKNEFNSVKQLYCILTRRKITGREPDNTKKKGAPDEYKYEYGKQTFIDYMIYKLNQENTSKFTNQEISSLEEKDYIDGLKKVVGLSKEDEEILEDLENLNKIEQKKRIFKMAKDRYIAKDDLAQLSKDNKDKIDTVISKQSPKNIKIFFKIFLSKIKISEENINYNCEIFLNLCKNKEIGGNIFLLADGVYKIDTLIDIMKNVGTDKLINMMNKYSEINKLSDLFDYINRKGKLPRK